MFDGTSFKVQPDTMTAFEEHGRIVFMVDRETLSEDGAIKIEWFNCFNTEVNVCVRVVERHSSETHDWKGEVVINRKVDFQKETFIAQFEAEEWFECGVRLDIDVTCKTFLYKQMATVVVMPMESSAA